MARMAMESGRSRTVAFTRAPYSRKRQATLGAPALQEADNRSAHARHETIPAGRVGNDVAAVERRAQDRGVGDLAAIAATDAGVVDRGHRIVAERIVEFLQRQRR